MQLLRHGVSVGTNYAFKVVSVVEGLSGVESKTLAKMPMASASAHAAHCV